MQNSFRSSAQVQPFFSIQPFWNIEMKDRHVWNDPCFHFLGQLMEYHNAASMLDSIPGLGLVGLIFSCDPQRPGAQCYGVLKGRRSLLPTEITDGIFIRFFPGEFTRLFGVPCNEIPAEGISLEALIGATSIVERMSVAQDWATRHRLLFELFLLQNRHPSDHELAIARQTIWLVQSNSGNIRIKDLERETLYSARYLQNVVQRQIGMSPKQLCDQVRMQNAVRLMHSGELVEGADLSQMLGFCDQSHFIRSFREYVGMSPSSFLKTK